MGFDSGLISFRRYAVVGPAPKAIEQSLLDQLSEHTLGSDEAGIPGEVNYGFSGGRHVLDDQFSFDNNVYAEALHFALRIDTNKVPTELATAYRMIEESAASKDNPSGFISKNQKRSARESAQQKIEEELRSGKYRRSRLTPILWDVPAGMLYCSAVPKAEEKLHEIFDRVFGLTLQPLSAGALALRMLESRSRRRDYEDARPTRFATGPEGEHQRPEYPWVAKGPEAKDFLGNEFMVWLWNQADTNGGVIDAEEVSASIFFDKALDLDCSFGQTGRALLRADGVAKMPEAHEALRTGKVPRRAGLIIESTGMQYVLTVAAETLAIRSLKLPNVEEADNPRVLFEERIAMLRDFCKSIDSLFAAFLKLRTASGWESQSTAIRKWAARSARPAMAMA